MNPALSTPKKPYSSRKGGAKMPMRIIITAGPTREYIDPIRFISNSSTGSMGYALAKAAKKRGRNIILISGPVSIKPPKKIERVNVVSACDMFKAIKQRFEKADCLIMAAAVSDFRPKVTFENKIKKGVPTKTRNISLVQNPDILSWAGKHKKDKLTIGFCMETRCLMAEAKRKLKTKNADIIVANKIDKSNEAFGDKSTTVYIIEKNGDIEKIGPRRKDKIASILLDKIECLWYKKNKYGHKIQN